MNNIFIIICFLVLSNSFAQTTTCAEGQFLNNATCTPCPIGAKTCQSSSIFLSCNNGFYQTTITEKSVACSPCINPQQNNSAGAMTCETGIKVLQCQNGYFLKLNQCAKCQQTNETCQDTCKESGYYTSSDNKCLSCQSANQTCDTQCSNLFVTSGTSCVSCPKGALKCSSPTIATSCLPSYYLSAGGLCQECPAGQQSCTTSSIATICASGFFLSSDNKVCTACAVSDKTECNSNCISAGFKSVGQTCVQCTTSTTAKCVSGCEQQGFFTKTVSTVADGKTTQTFSCEACGTGASSCTSSTVATKCNSGYYLGPNGICQACLNNQKTCSAQPIPTLCSQGYSKNQTLCVQCLQTTKVCGADCLTTGFYTLNSTCVNCGTGANKCINATYSTGCNAGYFLSGSTCLLVESGSLTTNSPQSTTCLSNYYLSSGKCLLCATGADTCSSKTVSLSCLSGYKLYQQVCTDCTQGGVLSGISQCSVPRATACKSGYYLSAGICTACSSNSDTCISATVALGCISNYYLTSEGACSQCGTKAYQCISSSIATTCQEGYYVAVPYISASCSQSLGSAQASGITADISSACIAGYVLNTDKKCTSCGTSQNIQTCTIDSTGIVTVTVCKDNYALYNNQCQDCSKLSSNVKSCKTSTKISSMKCLDGYYLSSISSCDICDTLKTVQQKPVLAASQFKTCKGSNTNYGNILQSDFTCDTDYFKVLVTYESKDYPYGCYECKGALTCEIAKYTLSSSSIAVPVPPSTIITTINCRDGYFLSADKTCSSCKTSFLTTSTLNIVLNQGQLLKCSGAAVNLFGNQLQSGFTCQSGYTPVKYKEATTSTTYIYHGCNECVGGSSCSYGDSLLINQVVQYTLSSITCKQGYFKESLLICSSCTTSQQLKAGDGTTLVYGQIYLITCSGGTTFGTTLQSGYTCATNYFNFKDTNSNPQGCAKCEGSSSCTINNILPYDTTQQVTVTVSGTADCKNGYYLSSDTTCSLCTSTALLVKANTAIINQDKLLTCGTSSTAYTIIASGTCQEGFVLAKGSNNVEINGCISCSQATNTAAETTGANNVNTCTIANLDYSLNAFGAITALTTTNCLDGYYLSALNTCSQCTTSTALKVKTGSTDAIINQDKLLTCATTGTAYTIIASGTCQEGFVLAKGSNNVEINGCISCSQATNTAAITTGANNVDTCTITDSSYSSNTFGTITLITTNCLNGYYLSALTTCSLCTSTALLVKANTAIINQDKLLTCGTSSTAYTIIASGTCQEGFVLAKGSNNVEINGCISCSQATNTAAETTGANNVNTCTIANLDYSLNAFGAITALTTTNCLDGYYLSALKECLSCKSSTTLKNEDDGIIYGQQFIKTCQQTSDKLTSITCEDNYGKLTQSSKIIGCYVCGTNIKICTNAIAATIYSTLTTTITTCQTQYYKSSNACSMCGSGQLSCSSSTQDIVCKDSYYLSTASTCTECQTSTNLKSADGITDVYGKSQLKTCKGAASGHGNTLQIGYTCETGYIPFEFTYSTSSTGPAGCVSCKGDLVQPTGYSTCSAPITSLSKISGSAISPGSILSSFYIINSCQNSYYYDSQNQICIQCNQQGGAVKTCKSQSIALTCNTGYVLLNKQCYACDSNVQSCSATSGYVTTCASGYLKIEGQCLKCSDNAKTCQGPAPTTCSNNYFIKDGVCSICGTGAKTCTSNAVATLCNAQYFLTSTNTCEQCGTGVSTCTSSTAALTCLTEYYLSSNTCTKCSAHTATCTDSSTSTKCNQGYFVSSNNCAACPNGASQCSSSSVATKCLSGFYLDSQNCHACSRNAAVCSSYQTITTCNSGYSLVSGICIVCPRGSSACSSTDIATACQTKYLLSNSQCIACQSNTDVCSKATYALTCSDSFFIQNGICVACGTGGLQCTSDTVASSCIDGYFLATTNSCTACGTQAKTCTSSTIALTCNTGYFKNANICTKCSSLATTCTSAIVATACEIGSSLISGSCVKCPTNANICSSTSVATSCNNEYALQGTKCISCLPGTKVCSTPQINQCSAGYVKVSNVCQKCASTTGACATGCTAVGFFSSSSSCTACASGARTCSSSTTANQCNSQYYKLNGVCTACPTGSEQCTSATVITTCSSGYFKETTNSVTKCTSCGTGSSVCLTASTSSSCKNGYYLNSLSQCTKCTNANSDRCSLSSFAVSCLPTFYPLNGVCLASQSSISACAQASLNLGYFTLETTTNNVTASSCVACGTGALSCSSATVAKSCSATKYLSSSATCIDCAANTQQCPLSVTLSSCLPGYSLINSQCVKCQDNVMTCSNSTTPLSCLDGYYLSNNKECIQCPSPSFKCTSDKIFQSCLGSYYQIPVSGSQVTCKLCPTTNNVKQCYNSTYATQCSTGFYPVKGICTACVANADTCDLGIVTKCQDGYYITNNTCGTCGAGAKTCTSNTTAISCSPNYGLSSGQCKQCAIGAETCTFSGVSSTINTCYAGFNLLDGACVCSQGFASSNEKCSSCSPNCSKCSSATDCSVCASPFKLSQKACSFNCTETNQYVNNTTPANPICSTCPTTCLTCSSSTVCLTCKDGITLSSENKCIFAQKLNIGNLIVLLGLFMGLQMFNRQ